MNKRLLFALVLMIFAFCLAAQNLLSISDFEMQVLQLTNMERAKYGLGALRYDAGLAALARRHSQNMHQYNFFAHKDIWGDLVADRRGKYYPELLVTSIGENLGKFTNSSNAFKPEDLLKGWMGSPAHKEQILDPGYTHLGVGISVKNGVMYATQNFAAPLVRLTSQIPERLSTKNQYILRFEYICDLDKSFLGATLVYPNPKTKYRLSETEEMLGAQPLEIKWIGDKTLELTVPFNAGKGDYKLCFGYGGGYFEEGILLKVK